MRFDSRYFSPDDEDRPGDPGNDSHAQQRDDAFDELDIEADLPEDLAGLAAQLHSEAHYLAERFEPSCDIEGLTAQALTPVAKQPSVVSPRVNDSRRQRPAYLVPMLSTVAAGLVLAITITGYQMLPKSTPESTTDIAKTANTIPAGVETKTLLAETPSALDSATMPELDQPVVQKPEISKPPASIALASARKAQPTPAVAPWNVESQILSVQNVSGPELEGMLDLLESQDSQEVMLEL